MNTADTAGAAMAVTTGLPPEFQTRPAAATRAAQKDAGQGEFLTKDSSAAGDEKYLGPMHIFALPLHRDGQVAGTLVLFHDTSYIETQVAHTLRDAFLNAAIQTLLISLLAFVLVRWTFTAPLKRTGDGDPGRFLRIWATASPDDPGLPGGHQLSLPGNRG